MQKRLKKLGSLGMGLTISSTYRQGASLQFSYRAHLVCKMIIPATHFDAFWHFHPYFLLSFSIIFVLVIVSVPCIFVNIYINYCVLKYVRYTCTMCTCTHIPEEPMLNLSTFTWPSLGSRCDTASLMVLSNSLVNTWKFKKVILKEITPLPYQAYPHHIPTKQKAEPQRCLALNVYVHVCMYIHM